MTRKQSPVKAPRTTVIAMSFLMLLVPLVGLGTSGQVDEISDALDESVCGIDAVAQIACTAGGERAWTAQYDGPGSSRDEFEAVSVNPQSGYVYGTGSSRGVGTGTDMATIAYDENGTQAWTSRYDGPANDLDFPSDMAVSENGAMVFITGESDGLNTGVDFATIAYDAETGGQIWDARYTGLGEVSKDQPRAITVSPDGSTVFVTGNSGGSLDSELTTVAYDATNGSELWIQRYIGPSDAFIKGAFSLGVGVSPDSSTVYVTGQTAGPGSGFAGNFDYTTIAYDAATGDELWLARYDGPTNGHDTATDLVVSPDGGHVYVTGYSMDSDNDFATIAYDATDGSEAWVARYNGPVDSDRAFAIGVSSDGSQVFVTGESASAQLLDWATVAYDALDGDQQWLQRYHSPDGGAGFETASDLAVSPEGSYMGVIGEADDRFTTVAYAMGTGEMLWNSRYEGGTRSAGNSVGISPDGERVYTAGTVHTDSNGRDGMMIAHEAFAGVSLPLPV